MANHNSGISPENMQAFDRLKALINIPPATRDWDNPLEKIEELLTCAICLDRYKTPKLLPCQHTFCLECMDGLMDHVRRNVKCPECRAEHQIPYEGVKSFQTNYTLMGFLEIHLQATEENAEELEAYIRRYNLERCKVCDEKAEVVLCAHCDKKLCVECKNTHMENVKRDLSRLSSQVKRLSNRITESSDCLSKGVDSFKLNCEAVKEEIKDYIRRFAKDLKKKEERLLHDLEMYRDSEVRLMKTLHQSLELESSNVNEACARVEAVLKGEVTCSDTDLAKFKQMFSEGLDFLRTFNVDSDDLTLKRVRFATVQDPQTIHKSIMDFGEITISTPPSGRFLQLEAQYVPKLLQLGLESDARVKARNIDLNDPSTWANGGTSNQQEQQKNKGRDTKYGQKTRSNQQQDDENHLSIRYRRRDQLETEAWQRLRGNTPELAGRRSPRANHNNGSNRDSLILVDDDDKPLNARQHLEVSPWSKVQQMEPAPPSPPEPAGSSSTAATSASAAPSASSSAAPAKPPTIIQIKPKVPTHLHTLAKQPSEDRALNERVDNIRKKHEQREHESAQAIAKIRTSHHPKQEDVPANKPPSSSSSEEEEWNNPVPIPVTYYQRSGSLAPEQREAQAPKQNKPISVVTSSAQSGVSDWKKYLIPSPPEAQRTAWADRRSSSKDDDSENSWLEKRKKFVRSKTNPDLMGSQSFSSLHAILNKPSDTSNDYKSRYSSTANNGIRNRYGNNEESEDTAGASSSAARSQENRRNRYRRKAENQKSHTANLQALQDSNGSSQDTNNSSNNSASQSVNNYRSCVQPKIAYKDKGRVRRKFGMKGSLEAQFNWPRGVAIIPTSEKFAVCDSSNHRLQVFDKRGIFERTFGGYGSSPGEFDCLAGIAINKYCQFVITDRYNHRVQIFDSNGKFLREFGSHGQTNGRFNNPWGVVVDNQGFIYVCDKDNHRVQIFQADGNFVGKFGQIGNREGQFQNPHFIAVNKQNQLVVTDSSNHRVQVFDHNGHYVFSFGCEGFKDGQFKYPRGIAIDNQGFIVVADSGNNRIQVFYPDGRFYSCFGSWGSGDGQLKGVEGVAITMDGHIVVTDRENHRVQVF